MTTIEILIVGFWIMWLLVESYLQADRIEKLESGFAALTESGKHPPAEVGQVKGK